MLENTIQGCRALQVEGSGEFSASGPEVKCWLNRLSIDKGPREYIDKMLRCGPSFGAWRRSGMFDGFFSDANFSHSVDLI